MLPNGLTRARARGPQGADRRGQRLVPRRLEERAPRPHRVRPPVRAPDVQRERALRQGVPGPARAGRRHRHERHDQRRPHQLLRRTCRPPRSTWRCGWSPTAWATCSARSTRRSSTSSAAWSRTRSARARTSPTARCGTSSRRDCIPPTIPYSWTVIGSMDDLNAASLDDVKDWFQTYYGPANAVLVLAGDIDVATAKAKVAQLFRRHPLGPAGGAPGDLGRQAHRQPARRHAGSRAAGPALQGVERARVGIGRRRLPGPRGVRAQHRQVLPAVQAAGLRRADRHRRGRLGRPARDRRALHHRGRRPPGRRSGPGRAGDRRGAGPSPRRRPDGGGAAARQDADACRVHPRAWSGSAGSAGSRTCWRRARCSRGGRTTTRCSSRASPAPPRHRCAARRRGGSRTACTRSRCSPSPSTPGALRRRPVRAAAARHAAGRRNSPRSSAPRSPTASRSSWPSAGRFRWCGSTCCSTPASRRTSSPSRARPASR